MRWQELQLRSSLVDLEEPLRSTAFRFGFDSIRAFVSYHRPWNPCKCFFTDISLLNSFPRTTATHPPVENPHAEAQLSVRAMAP